MSHRDQRAFERIPCFKRTRIWMNGRLVSPSLAINLSLGGLLLAPIAAASLGSLLEVELPGSRKLEGRVVRHDMSGTAIQFQQTLELNRFQAVVQAPSPSVYQRLTGAYMDYLHAGQVRDDATCERLVGVSRRVYSRVFLVTFVGSLSLAVLAAWLLRGLYLHHGTVLKIGLSFGYGALVMAVFQPAMDLLIFRMLRSRKV